MKNYLLMKTHNKFSQMREEQGHTNPVNGTARHRISIGSIVSRYSLATLICTLMLTLGVGNVWGQASTHTSNVTLTAGTNGSACPVSISGNNYSGIKMGASNKTGSMSFSVPAGVTTVYVHAARWNGDGNGNLNVSRTSGTVTPSSLSLTADAGVSGSSPFTLSDPSKATTSYFFTLTLQYQNSATTITLTTSSKRAVVWGVNTASATKTFNLKVPDGTGGYTTRSSQESSAMTEATATGGHSCGSGLAGYYASIWVTSAISTPTTTYPSPNYTSSNIDASSVASGINLYPVFTNDAGKYLTNPLCDVVCSNTVTPAAGTKTNVTTIAFDKASVETCSETASDRQVTVTITPASCYAVPSSTRLAVTGTSASYVSGPTDNGNGTYSFVYQFAQNATSTSTFAASLATKTTYTVSYNKGTYGTGENSSDTKTCGENLTLPSSAMFTRDHYTQTGWSTAAAGNTKTYNLGANYTTDAATTLYPYWEAEKFTVTWSVNGSTYTTTANVSYNTTTSTPANPTPSGDCAGLVFRGWTATANYEHATDAPGDMFNNTTPAITGNITFHAVFAEVDN